MSKIFCQVRIPAHRSELPRITHERRDCNRAVTLKSAASTNFCLRGGEDITQKGVTFALLHCYLFGMIDKITFAIRLSCDTRRQGAMRRAVGRWLPA
jgi:hypothetical protein